MKKIGLFFVCFSFSLHAMQDDGLETKIGYACALLQECATGSSADTTLRVSLYKEVFIGYQHMPLSLLAPDLRKKLVLLKDEKKQESLFAAIEYLNTLASEYKGGNSFAQQCVRKINEYGHANAITLAQELRVLANLVIEESDKRHKSTPASPTGRGSFLFGYK